MSIEYRISTSISTFFAITSQTSQTSLQHLHLRQILQIHDSHDPALAVDDRQIVNLDNAGAAGLWRLDFANAKDAQFEFVDVDVSGVQGALFLSAEKYWK